MHKEILSPEQFALLKIVKLFSGDFGLVGGTAIALHLGHRVAKIDTILRDETGQFTLVINGVRFTFFQFPYKINFSESFGDIVKLPDILTLAAMKAFALGRRAKWKDYVDLYFIMKANHPVSAITAKGVEIFGNEFNEKIFRTQLAYFEDIDYSEKIIYKDGFLTDDEIIKKALVEFSLER